MATPADRLLEKLDGFSISDKISEELRNDAFTAANFIRMAQREMIKILGRAHHLLRYGTIVENINTLEAKLNSINGETAKAIASNVLQTTKSLQGMLSPAGVITGSVINVLGNICAICLNFYAGDQDKEAVLKEINFLREVLVCHLYLDLSRKYLEENIDRYASRIDKVETGIQLQKMMEDVIRDFSYEASALLYIQHACLIKALKKRSREKFLGFLCDSIRYHAEEEPFTMQYRFSESQGLSGLLDAAFPEEESPLFFKDQILIKKRHRILVQLDNQYTIKFYLHYADRLMFNKESNEIVRIKIKDPSEVPGVREGGVNLHVGLGGKYHHIQCGLYPSINLTINSASPSFVDFSLSNTASFIDSEAVVKRCRGDQDLVQRLASLLDELKELDSDTSSTDESELDVVQKKHISFTEKQKHSKATLMTVAYNNKIRRLDTKLEQMRALNQRPTN